MNLLLFEWRLWFRSKRLKQMLFSMSVLALLLPLQLISLSLSPLFIGLLLVVLISLFTQYAPFSLAINASFVEKQLTMPLSMFRILQTKYYFFAILSLFPLIFSLTVSFWTTFHFLNILSAFVFIIGFMFFGSFYCLLFSYKPFNIKTSASYNFQGMDKGNHFFPILVLLIGAGFILLIYWLLGETVAIILKTIIGLTFIATHRTWLNFIAKKIENKKYYRLERFRQN